jgi:hypothetical protein
MWSVAEPHKALKDWFLKSFNIATIQNSCEYYWKAAFYGSNGMNWTWFVFDSLNSS